MDKKTLILAKKPISGGMPAIENTVSTKDNAIAELDFLSKTKSPNSLLRLSVYRFRLIQVIKITNQTIIPESI